MADTDKAWAVPEESAAADMAYPGKVSEQAQPLDPGMADRTDIPENPDTEEVEAEVEPVLDVEEYLVLHNPYQKDLTSYKCS